MSTVDREIRITSSDNGVFDRLSKLKEGALSIGRGVAEDARKQATSSREFIKLIKEEISLIEKRNKLNKETREVGAREKFSGDKSGLSKELQKISVESKEDKIQTDLLKQILQATLKTSQEEITADREGVKKQIRSDTVIDQMDDNEEAIKSMMTKSILRDTEPLSGESKEESKSRAASTIGQLGGFVRNTDMYTMGFSGASQAAKSGAGKVENKFASRALAAGGLILGAIGMSMGLTGDYYESEGDLFRATGSKGGYEGIDKADLTQSQANKRIAQFNLRSNNKLDRFEASNLLKLERSQGIDSEQLATIGMQSGESPSLIYGAMKSMMGDRGLSKSRTSDMLSAVSSLSEQQFMATGESSGVDSAGILNRIMSGQKKSDPRRASATAGRLDALAKGGNDQMEAIKFSEYQKKYPGKDYTDYLEEKEKGVGGEIDDLFIKRVLSTKMSDKDKKLSLYNAGLTMSDAKTVISAGSVSPLKSKDIRKDSIDSLLEGVIGDEGQNKITKSSAFVTDSFEKLGVGTLELVKILRKLTADKSGNTIHEE